MATDGAVQRDKWRRQATFDQHVRQLPAQANSGSVRRHRQVINQENTRHNQNAMRTIHLSGSPTPTPPPLTLLTRSPLPYLSGLFRLRLHGVFVWRAPATSRSLWRPSWRLIESGLITEGARKVERAPTEGVRAGPRGHVPRVWS